MNPAVTIVEILGRSEQGMTRPFRCRGDDEKLYYVKGNYAGLNSLCCEWVAGNLAQAMGLPLPEFAIASVPESLVMASDRSDIRDLGAGLVFASERLEEAREITWLEACASHEEIMASVMLFDWWVHNEDRCLSALGGNPNLLMTADGSEHGKLWMFDFNMAFDPEFSRERFLENHVFAKRFGGWPAGFREKVDPKMHLAINELNDFLASLPSEWLHLEGSEELPSNLDQDMVRSILSRPFLESDAFWNLL